MIKLLPLEESSYLTSNVIGKFIEKRSSFPFKITKKIVYRNKITTTFQKVDLKNELPKFRKRLYGISF